MDASDSATSKPPRTVPRWWLLVIPWASFVGGCVYDNHRGPDNAFLWFAWLIEKWGGADWLSWIDHLFLKYGWLEWQSIALGAGLHLLSALIASLLMLRYLSRRVRVRAAILTLGLLVFANIISFVITLPLTFFGV